jgi:hypothetical protein
MANFEIVVQLAASPEASWAFVVDHGEDIEPLTFRPRGVQGPGVLNDLTGRLLGIIPIRGVSRMLAWEPPVRCVFESVKPAWPVRTLITETFEPEDGGTRHCIRYEVAPIGAIGRAAAPLVAKLMKRSRTQYQIRLQAALNEDN